MNLDFRIILKKIFFIFTNRSLKRIAYSASISEKVILKKVSIPFFIILMIIIYVNILNSSKNDNAEDIF